jgi:hypothetical protein
MSHNLPSNDTYLAIVVLFRASEQALEQAFLAQRSETVAVIRKLVAVCGVSLCADKSSGPYERSRNAAALWNSHPAFESSNHNIPSNPQIQDIEYTNEKSPLTPRNDTARSILPYCESGIGTTRVQDRSLNSSDEINFWNPHLRERSSESSNESTPSEASTEATQAQDRSSVSSNGIDRSLTSVQARSSVSSKKTTLPTPHKQLSIASQPSKVIKVLEDKLQSIKKILSNENELVLDLQRDVDYRIADLRVHDKASRHSVSVAVRRNFSQLSLANEFMQWEQTQCKVTKLARLTMMPDGKHRWGNISNFLSYKGFLDKEVVNRGIKKGFKKLVGANLFGSKGILLLLAFAESCFRKLTYKEVPVFVQLLQASHDMATFARKLSDLYLKAQRCYDSGCLDTILGEPVLFSFRELLLTCSERLIQLMTRRVHIGPLSVNGAVYIGVSPTTTMLLELRRRANYCTRAQHNCGVPPLRLTPASPFLLMPIEQCSSFRRIIRPLRLVSTIRFLMRTKQCSNFRCNIPPLRLALASPFLLTQIE